MAVIRHKQVEKADDGFGEILRLLIAIYYNYQRTPGGLPQKDRVHRFTPRKPKSIWSAVNIERVGELERLGRMMPPGLKAFAGRDEQKAMQYSYERSTCKLEGAYEKQFRGIAKAWEFFQAQPPGYRRTATWWVISAKREETRGKRLATLMETSERGHRLDMLAPQTKKKSGSD